MINLYKLELFVIAVEEGSFSAAAEQVLMTQSGVSQHIQDLEEQLGVELFTRGRRGVTPTKAGTTLYTYAQRILALVAEMENAVTDVAHLTEGQTQIGATPGVSVYILSEWVQTFRKRYPNLTVTLQTDITPVIVEKILSRQLDAGIIEGELDAEIARKLEVAHLQTIDQCVVVGKQHPFWSRDAVTMADLDSRVFVMRQPVSQTRLWLDEMLDRYGVKYRVAAEFDNVESIKRTVIGGDALTILPEYAVRSERDFGLLRAIPIVDRPLQRTLKLIWDKRRHLSPVTRALLGHLQGCFPRLRQLVSAQTGGDDALMTISR